MAAEAEPSLCGAVLELGPGTGAITAALILRGFAPWRITAIEYDAHFATALQARFPTINVVQGDAFALAAAGERFAAIVSSLPLLNFPLARRKALIDSALSRLLPGAPYIQFSYGFAPPVAAPEGACVKLAARVWRNLPPARVWVYRRR
ncbi:MAG: methyltransferase domain-containing protein [Alphaproteobacteria bacterium]|nr:methyltransferase domain-containing protein [Alphaproteobacteria bacterium]MDE2109713.1 methyltransferase domain-containing protein [Alphaproteobacteria bacterium]MDE2494944.1 methyltransferase domain-containing protein [Alphaproteobacteria bacterium]